MSRARRIVSTENAPWLPPGSCAEVWAGDDCRAPEPSIIVRLLLTSADADARRTFFCVLTPKGPDLPTLFLGRGPERMSLDAGLAELQRRTLGREGLQLRCVGYVRNVVPSPDASYPHPTPHAHVPVFVAPEGTTPAVEGRWVAQEHARGELDSRHWWPIVAEHLS